MIVDFRVPKLVGTLYLHPGVRRWESSVRTFGSHEHIYRQTTFPLQSLGVDYTPGLGSQRLHLRLLRILLGRITSVTSKSGLKSL